MSHVATDLLGKRVTVWHMPDWASLSSVPRRGITGVVRAVSFGYPPGHFSLLIQRDRESGADEMAGELRIVSISHDGLTSVVPESEQT